MPAHQVRYQFRESIELVLCPAEFDSYVMAVDETGFLQAVAERRYPVDGIDSRRRVEKADYRHRRLLRTRRERPKERRATEKCDEFPPPHRAYRRAKDHELIIAPCIAAKSGDSCPSGVKSGEMVGTMRRPMSAVAPKADIRSVPAFMSTRPNCSSA